MFWEEIKVRRTWYTQGVPFLYLSVLRRDDRPTIYGEEGKKIYVTVTRDYDPKQVCLKRHNRTLIRQETLNGSFQIYLVKIKLQPAIIVITPSNYKRKLRIPSYLTKQEFSNKRYALLTRSGS